MYTLGSSAVAVGNSLGLEWLLWKNETRKIYTGRDHVNIMGSVSLREASYMAYNLPHPFWFSNLQRAGCQTVAKCYPLNLKQNVHSFQAICSNVCNINNVSNIFWPMEVC